MTRHPMRGLALALVATTTLTSCWWWESVSREVDPLEFGPPPVEDPVLPGGPSNALPPDPMPPDGTGASGDRPPIPSIEPGSASALSASVRVLDSGLTLITRAWPSPTLPTPCHFRLVFPHAGQDTATALLCSRLTLDAPGGAAGRPPLRAALAQLGADVEATVGPDATAIDIVAPRVSFANALAEVGVALADPPASRNQIERLQGLLLRDLARDLTSAPTTTAIERVLGRITPGVGTWLDEIQDLDAARVAIAHQAIYQPRSALLGAIIPGLGDDETEIAISVALKAWSGTPETPATEEPEATDPETTSDESEEAEIVHGPALVESPVAETDGTVFWATTPTSEPTPAPTAVDPGIATVAASPSPPTPPVADAVVAIVRPFLEPSTPASAAAATVQQVVSASGLGGRVVKAFVDEPDATMLAFDTGVIDWPTRKHEVLLVRVPTARVAATIAAWEQSARSLRRDPATPDEIDVAARRARLRLLADESEPTNWLRAACRAALQGRLDTYQALATGSGFPSRRAEALGRLGRSGTLTIDDAAIELGTAAFAVVLAPAPPPPELADRVRTVADFAVTERADAFRAEPIQQDQAAITLIGRAIEAVGGALALRAIDGFVGSGRSRSGHGPDVLDDEWYRFGGDYRRVRRVLSTTIETVVGADGKGREVATTASGAGIELSAEEGANNVAALQRHPLFVLRATLDRSLRFRLIGMREIADREIAVLERIVPEGPRLRVHVDTQSGLIRRVDAEEHRPEIGPVLVREDWDDYRNVDGVRIPHYRVRYVDDTVRGVVTEWTSARAAAPAPELLKLGASRDG